MWYKKLFSILLYAALIGLVLFHSSEGEAGSTENKKQGNTHSNLMNGGIAAEEGGWIYYASGSGIWKMKNDGTVKEKLSEEKVHSLNVLDGWIYYIGESNGIYKLKTDGSGRTELTSDYAIQISVIGNDIYYIKRSEPSQSLSTGIYKMDILGKNKICIIDQSLYTFRNINVEGNKIYYFSNNALTRINDDGTGKMYVACMYNILQTIKMEMKL